MNITVVNLDFRIVNDPADVPLIWEAVQNSPVLSIDLETTGLDHNRDHVHGIAICNATHEWYITGDALPDGFQLLRELAGTDKMQWFHNAIFDLHFLVPKGIVPANIADSMVAYWMLDPSKKLGLKALAETELGVHGLVEFKDMLKARQKELNDSRKPGEPRITKFTDVSIYDLDQEKLAEYACKDVRLTYMLGMKASHELEKEGMLDLFYEQEMPFMWVLERMERNGVAIDLPYVAELRKEFDAKRAQLLDRWNTMTQVVEYVPAKEKQLSLLEPAEHASQDDDVPAGMEKVVHEVNFNSTQQLGALLYERMGYEPTRYSDKTDAPSTDVLSLIRANRDSDPCEYGDESEEVCDNHRCFRHGVIGTLLELRQVDKLISTYVLTYETKHFNGRLYAGFNQTGTATSRLSSSGPNLQNQPSRGWAGKAMRRTFIARPGYKLIVIDYSAVEMRVAAHFCKDPALIRIFLDGLDMHQITADTVGVSRRDAKTVGFGKLFGMQWKGFCDAIEKMGFPRPEKEYALMVLNGWDKAYPGWPTWVKNAIAWAIFLGKEAPDGIPYVTTITGHKRKLPSLTAWNRYERGAAEREAISTIVQGSAAALLKQAMIDIDSGIGNYWGHDNVKMVLQVHDELVFEVREDLAEQVAPWVQGIMVGMGKQFNLRVPLVAEPLICDNWAEAKD